MPLAVVSWPSNMNVSTSARMSFRGKTLPSLNWGRQARVHVYPILCTSGQSFRALLHTHSGKKEDVQEIQVPLSLDIVQLSILQQMHLPLLDHLVCPRTVVSRQS